MPVITVLSFSCHFIGCIAVMAFSFVFAGQTINELNYSRNSGKEEGRDHTVNHAARQHRKIGMQARVNSTKKSYKERPEMMKKLVTLLAIAALTVIASSAAFAGQFPATGVNGSMHDIT